MILVTKWFGVFLCKADRVVRKTLFPKDPMEMAQRLAAIQRGEVLPEERAMAQEKVDVAEPRLSPIGKPVVFDSSFIRPENLGYDQTLMHQVMMELGKIRTREPVRQDRIVIQAIRALDSVIEIINLMSERLHEWYGLHFPELADYARDERYSILIAEHGAREGIIPEIGVKLESVGAELTPADMEAVRALAASLVDLHQQRTDLENYVRERASECAPNLSCLISEMLAARLISLAGGLDRLAKLPSSTVQLLGAEKAMFRHLKGHKDPPKHGIIYQYPDVHRSPYWQRGKVSRALAAKISIAARLDQFGGEFMGEELKTDLERKLTDIRQRYPNPPKKRASKSRGKSRRR